jgi:4,5-DOPA dioxygenase extradiol
LNLNQREGQGEQEGSAAMANLMPAIFFGHVYVLATGQNRDSVSFPVEGVDGGSISMLAVQTG